LKKLPDDYYVFHSYSTVGVSDMDLMMLKDFEGYGRNING